MIAPLRAIARQRERLYFCDKLVLCYQNADSFLANCREQNAARRRLIPVNRGCDFRSRQQFLLPPPYNKSGWYPKYCKYANSCMGTKSYKFAKQCKRSKQGSAKNRV